MPRMYQSAVRARSGSNMSIVDMEDLKKARERRASSARHSSPAVAGRAAETTREPRGARREEPSRGAPLREEQEGVAFWQRNDPFGEGHGRGRARVDDASRRLSRSDERREIQNDDEQDQGYDFRRNRREAETAAGREELRRPRQVARGRETARTRAGNWNRPQQEPDYGKQWEFEFRPQPAAAPRTRQENNADAYRDSRRRPANDDAPETWRRNRDQASQGAAPRSRTWYYALFLLLALSALGAVIGVNAFNIKSVDVKGNTTITAQTIAALSGINPGQNIFMADLTRARSNIESDPMLIVTGISRVLPDKIQISVKQRAPHGAIAYLGGYVVIDENGVVLDVRDSLPAGQYPLITGVEIQPSEKGKKVNGLDGNVLKPMYDVLSALYDGKAMQYISTINLSNLGDIRMYTGEGIEIDIGAPTDLAQKAQWIAGTVPQLRTHGYTSGTLHLTGVANPVFTESQADAGSQDQNAPGQGGGDSGGAA